MHERPESVNHEFIELLQDWIDFSASLAAVMLLPYQLLLLVAEVAMIRAASSNSSVNGLIRRGQMLYGATTEQLRPTMKGTVSTWIVQHCKSTQFLQSMELSLLFSSTFSQSNDGEWRWRNSSINRWPLCDLSSRLSITFNKYNVSC